MNAEKIQKLIEYLNQLESGLQKFPGLMDKFAGALNSARGALEAITSRDFIGSTTELDRRFNALFQTFESGSKRGVAGLTEMLSKMEQLSEVSRYTNAVSQGALTGRGTFVPPVTTENQELAQEFRDLGVQAEAAFDIAERGAKEFSASLDPATEKLREIKRETQTSIGGMAGVPGPDEAGRLTTGMQEAGRATRDASQEQVAFSQRVQDTAKRLNLSAKDTETFANALSGLSDEARINTRIQRDLNSGVTRFKVNVQDVETFIDSAGEETQKLTGEMTFLEGRFDTAGNAVLDSTGKFRSFGDTVLRNVAEVAKWSIAVGAVYGTIQQGQRIIEEAIDNQTKLAEISIVLGNSQRSLNTIFSNALDIARQTGSSVEGVLDSYTEAIRVTANLTDETERFAVANQLLYDSLVLSKLGGLEQAEAMDVLIGALGQVNLPLSEGSELLDRWVATSRVAGVTLGALAETYSIAGAAARSAGVQVGGVNDQLSALTAIIAQRFPYGDREVANRIRALVTTFQDPSKQEGLFGVGISPVNAEGQIRPFLEILQELDRLYSTGIIDDDDLLKITGNNQREYAVLLAAIQDVNKVLEVSEQATENNGAAQEALGKQLETVRTSIDRLGNAFASLGNTLGTEGGVLEAITRIVDLFTSLVEVVGDLIQITGQAGPALALLLGANAVYAKGFNVQGGFAGRIAGAATAGIGAVGQRAAQGAGRFTSEGFVSGATVAANRFATRVGNVLPGIMAGAVSSALSASDLKDGLKSFGVQAAGALIGGIVGGPIGSLVGSQIALGFTDALNSDVEVFQGMGQQIALGFQEGIPDPADDNTSPDAENPDDILNYTRQYVSGIRSQLGNLLTGLFSREYFVSQLENLGIDRALVEAANPDKLTNELLNAIGTAIESGADPEKYNQLLEGLRDTGLAAKDAEDAQLAYNQAINAVSVDALRAHSGTLEEVRQQLNRAFADAQIGAEEYLSQLDRINEIPQQISGVLQVFGDEIVEQVDSVDTLEEAWEELFDVFLRADPAIGRKLQELATVDTTDMEQFNRLAREAINLITSTPRNAIYDPSQIDVPQTIDISEVESLAQFEEILQQMEILAANYAAAIGGEMGEEIVEGMRQAVLFSAGDVFSPYEDIIPEFFNQAKQNVTGGGTSARQNFGFQEIDLPSSAYGQIQQAINYFASELGKLGYQEQRQPTAIRFSDDIIQVKDVDNQLLQLALNELIDVNRDQLQGIYNLPTDASFYVPFTGYQLGFGEDGAGGLGNLPTVDLEGSDVFSSAVNRFGSAVDGINDWLQQGQPLDNEAELQSRIDAFMTPFNQQMQQIQTVEDILRNLPFIGANSGGTGSGGPTTWTPDSMAQAVAAGLNQSTLGISLQGKGTKGGFSPLESGKLSEQLSQINQNLINSFNIGRVDNIPPVDLRVQLQSVAQLTLDGRLIAQSVKQHLAQDLIRFQGSGGGATIRYVV